jgi:hypothetical protein
MIATFHIAVAMKPLDGNFAQNALNHGVAGLNVDGCRVGLNGEKPKGSGNPSRNQTEVLAIQPVRSGGGRWPANLIHDGSDEVVGLFPSPHGAGYATDGKHCSCKQPGYRKEPGAFQYGEDGMRFGDTGSAARFFKQIDEYKK